ncbi:MAG: serine/threonine-protein kinase [Pirellulaceae bacterium]|nr:serine/threonine-protein kinase [Pirellulaceae bacterium]
MTTERGTWARRQKNRSRNNRHQFAPLNLASTPTRNPSQLDFGIAAGFGLSEPTELRPPAISQTEVGMLIGGKYKLTQAIGEGGMGTVWLAEQKEPVKRKVAIKLVKAGMDSRQVLARFEAERQALAMMDHPNIAKVFDGGVTDQGRPYFAMELVKGIPITNYCDQVQFSVRERLELFAQVCSAVQHAHQKGIIHRDLKPSNVLVTEHDGRPVVKVIDFGLAKALHGSHTLTEMSMNTAFGAVLGTPLYMAPEQLGTSALDVDTRADLYSIGVILYELLTGTTPIERQRLKQAAWAEMCRLIREEEPQRPSTRLSSSDTLNSVAARRHVEPAKLTRLIRGELDWIIMKALEKDRNRRYETANGLGMDIQRYLNNEPVLASPPSRIYRWRKFVARNKWQTLAGAMVLLALFTLVGFAVSLSYTGRLALAFDQEAAARVMAEEKSVEAERQRQQAELSREAANKSREIANEQRVVAEVARGETTEALQLAERYAYFHKIALADSAFQSGDVQRSDQLLEDCPVVDRGFEWNLLKRRNHDETSSLTGHTGKVYRVRYSPEGSVVVSCGDEGSIRLWDSEDGRELAHLDEFSGSVTDVAMHPSGRFVAATGENGKLMVWDVTTQRVLHDIDRNFNGAGFLAYESRGTCLIIVNSNRIEFRDANNYRLVHSIADAHSGAIRALAVSPDGKQLATASWDQTIKIWDVDVAKHVRTIQALSGSLMAVAWSPDGLHLAASGMDFTITVWESATGQLLQKFSGHEFTTRDLSFSPDGRHLASAGADGSVKVWDWRQRELVQTFLGHYGHVTSVDWDTQGRFLISGGFDGTVKRWSVTGDSDGLVVHSEQTSIKSNRIAFGPDGTWIVKTDSDDRLEIVDAKTGAVRRRSDAAFPGSLSPATGLDVHPDGKSIAIGDLWGRIDLVDVESCEVVWSAANTPANNSSLKFSPDGQWLVSGNTTGELGVWDVKLGRYLRPLADPAVPLQPSDRQRL